MPTPHIRYTFGQGELRLIQGDITTSRAEVIVTAANPRLAGGGGVDGAVHCAAGPELLAACREHIDRYGSVFPGYVAVTPGFGLAAGLVIHAVGPIWNGGDFNEETILQHVHERALEEIRDQQATWAAFPAISCGSYGFPAERAAPVALNAVSQALNKGLARRVDLYLYTEDEFSVWVNAAEALFGPGEAVTGEDDA